MSAPDWEGFARAIMAFWPEGGVDGCDIQDFAVKYRLIKSVAGGFDERVHADDFGVGAEAGDEWFMQAFPEARDCQCGGEATLSRGHAPGAGDACAVWCLDCGATGPADEGERDAVKAWNYMMERKP